MLDPIRKRSIPKDLAPSTEKEPQMQEPRIHPFLSAQS